MASSNIADPPPSHPAQSLPDYSWPTDTLGSALPAVQDDLDANENIFFQKALLEFAVLFGLRQISTFMQGCSTLLSLPMVLYKVDPLVFVGQV